MIDESVEWADVKLNNHIPSRKPDYELREHKPNLVVQMNPPEVTNHNFKFQQLSAEDVSTANEDQLDTSQDSRVRHSSRHYSDPSIDTDLRKEMAPDHRTWPPLVTNLIGFSKQARVSNSSAESANEIMSNKYTAQSSSLILRLLLDRFASYIQHTPELIATGDRKTRSTATDNADRSSDGVASENEKSRNNDDEDDYDSEDEENKSDQGDDTETNEVDQPIATSDGVDKSDNDNELNKISERIVNFKSPNNKLKLKMTNIKLDRPPAYPPGDADKLYSDALLVYVKDFNQYIS